MSNGRLPAIPTSLGTADTDSMRLLGHDVTEDLMGQVSFGELALWLLTLKRPTPGQVRLFEAVLVGLADHGFTPIALASRLTLLSAPESIQGAIAAGLLGGGSRYLGVTEDTARLLAAGLASAGELPIANEAWDGLAERVLRDALASGVRRIAGLGHHLHKNGDPRTDTLFRLAREEGVFGPHLSLFAAIGRVHPAVLGKELPLNGAGTSGAVLADLGIAPELTRGPALLARCAGLLGHIAEEQRQPIADAIFRAVDRNATYVEPEY